MNNPNTVPVLVFLAEVDTGSEGTGLQSDVAAEAQAILPAVCAELQAAAHGGAQCGEVDVVLAGYSPGRPIEPEPPATFSTVKLRLQVGGNPGTTTAPWENSVAIFSNLESALMALGTWLLRRAEANSPVLVLHVTRGGFVCCENVERAAGTLKTACDFRGAPSVIHNVWLTDTAGFSFPDYEAIAKQANPVVKTLFRMSSPVGKMASEILSELGNPQMAAPRCFEAVASVKASLMARFTVGFFTKAAPLAGNGGTASSLENCAFLMPKEGETIDKCEDVVSIHHNCRSFAIADGATTASYSAEWARALCRHAVESPPPAFPETFDGLAEEIQKENAQKLRSWLAPALSYWAPEVPWERLIRPSGFNKAKEGSGAALAGVELSEITEGGAVTFRGWALGDSCVIHLRGDRMASSVPMATSAHFSHVPALLMTRAGYEEKYLRFWQSWEATLEANDMLMLGTDAFCKYVLKSFENGTEGDLLGWLNGLWSSSRAEAWQSFEEFVQLKRKQGEVENDDVGLILIRMRKDGAS